MQTWIDVHDEVWDSIFDRGLIQTTKTVEEKKKKERKREKERKWSTSAASISETPAAQHGMPVFSPCGK